MSRQCGHQLLPAFVPSPHCVPEHHYLPVPLQLLQPRSTERLRDHPRLRYSLQHLVLRIYPTGETMAELQKPFTRRAFLSRLAAGSAGAVVVSTLSAPQALLAANDPERARALDPNFIAGTLVDFSTDHVMVHAEGYGPPMRVRLTDSTEICSRGICKSRPNVLEVGDRVEVSTYYGPGGERVARWLNANFIATMGMISAIEGNVVRVDPMPGKVRPVRELVISPGTMVYDMHGGELGRIDKLSVGTSIHFCALADTPDAGVLRVKATNVTILYPAMGSV